MVKNYLSVRELILNIIEIASQYKKVNIEYDKAILNGKKGQAQKFQVHLQSLLKKKSFYQDSLKNKLNSTVVKIRYKWDNTLNDTQGEDEALLVNLSKIEAENILMIALQLKGYNIEILESIEISTFLSKGKL